ncbi:uncharacterized protein LOC120653506 [Panicum virgatum]|uniref:uncharacterized protein LOC120653506 n=1 Tax=Panicum virgatum TaxID=38727 RepID=UPI0019D53063|nr:uncharacterized protein LOC120653506 [Panicum virgatum]
MPGIPREVAEHELRILPGSKPVQQRLRRFDDERRRAIGEEIAKLLATGFIKEIFHSDWLSNSVLVKKKNGQWRMCVDYTNLNKAYFSDQINPPIDLDRADLPRATVAVYVDDIVVKTPHADDLVASLSATFANLKRFNIKLNPEKCTFGFPKGKLLGYMVSERGIEANCEKIAAITNMGPIHGIKGVQRLTECLAALSRFIVRLGE